MIFLALQWAGVLVCALVLAGCICRIGLMNAGRNRYAWFVIYAAFAVYALGVGLDLATSRGVDWYECAGIGGLLLYLALTRHLWHGGSDPVTVRQDLRNADGTPAP